MKRSALTAIAVSLGIAAAACGTAAAQNFPDKPVDYVIPFGPGGESDISARLQQPYFKDKFGQDLVISYKEGGGGAVGCEWSTIFSRLGAAVTLVEMLPSLLPGEE